MYIFLYVLSEAFRVLGFNYNYVISFWLIVYLIFSKKNQIVDFIFFAILSIGIFFTVPDGSLNWHEPLVLWILLSFQKEMPNFNLLILIALCFLSIIFFDLYPNYYGILIIIISSNIGYKNLKFIELFCMLLLAIFIDQKLLMLYVFIISCFKYKKTIKNYFIKYRIVNILILTSLFYLAFLNIQIINTFFVDLRLLSYLYFFNPFDISQDYVDYFFLNIRNNNIFFEAIRLFQLNFYLFTFIFITGTVYSIYRARKNNLEYVLTIIFIASFERLDIFYII